MRTRRFFARIGWRVFVTLSTSNTWPLPSWEMHDRCTNSLPANEPKVGDGVQIGEHTPVHSIHGTGMFIYFGILWVYVDGECRKNMTLPYNNNMDPNPTSVKLQMRWTGYLHTLGIPWVRRSASPYYISNANIFHKWLCTLPYIRKCTNLCSCPSKKTHTSAHVSTLQESSNIRMIV